MQRQAAVTRKTGETEVTVEIRLDGSGNSKIDTGIGFFDHMLQLFARHGLFDLNVCARGDLEVDPHHTVEDTGIAMGQAIKEALGDKKSIKRYGSALVPMDEALAGAVVDISGRPYLVYNVKHAAEKVGWFDTELAEEFFRALAFNGGLTVHLNLLYGSNSHHVIEALFKAFGRALDQATQTDDRITGVMSTKGVL